MGSSQLYPFSPGALAFVTKEDLAQRETFWTTDWWAHQDSNLEPRDSRGPKVSLWRGLSLHPPRVACGWGAGRSSLLWRALKPSGSLCTFRRCTAGLAQGCRRSALASLRVPWIHPDPVRALLRDGTFRWVPCSNRWAIGPISRGMIPAWRRMRDRPAAWKTESAGKWFGSL